jgi:hypothetical protein
VQVLPDFLHVILYELGLGKQLKKMLILWPLLYLETMSLV